MKMVTIQTPIKYHETTCLHCNKEVKALIVSRHGSIKAYLNENAQYEDEITLLGCPECKGVMWIEQSKIY